MKQPISSRQRLATFRRERKQPGASAGDAAPSSNGQPESKPKPNKEKRRHFLKQYVHWLWPFRIALSVLFILALLAAVLDMAWPWAIKIIIDRVLLNPSAQFTTARRLAMLNVIGGSILAIVLLKQIVDSIRSYRTSVLNANVVFRLRRRLYESLLNLPLGALGEMKSGGIVSRLSGDVDSVSGLVQMAIISPAVAALRILLTIAILFALSWRLALAAMITVPPMALISFLWLRRIRPIYRSVREDRSVIDARVSETFGGVRVVRAFRREPHEQRSYAVGHHTIIRKGLFAEMLELILESAWGILIPATVLLIVWYGGRLYLHTPRLAQIGDITAFQIYAMMLLQPVWQIISSVSQTQKALAAMERVFEAMEMPPDKPDLPDAIDAPREVREIRFEQVNFEYRPDVPVIRDFTLEVPGGSVVALVGPSGAGKTTVTDLVARFHDPTSGRILLNGIDLRKLRLHSYRQLLAVVQQETFLFDGTVRENIAYGRRGASDEEVIDAARRANAHEFITQLPEQYETIIGERGFKLSGGQRQRISIARAILADPQILILDEATSNLDTESEQLIQSALSELLKRRTTFVIAHRLSTVTHADLIVVLDQGRIVEVGSHDQLMDRRGLYYDMVERQRLSFAPTSADMLSADVRP
jgi:ATP-binding cassette subfamily B protein/subfamily B ATP-binding cassette protein MsbA